MSIILLLVAFSPSYKVYRTGRMGQ